MSGVALQWAVTEGAGSKVVVPAVKDQYQGLNSVR